MLSPKIRDRRLRLITSLADLLVNAVAAAIDSAVLRSHDSLDGGLVLDCATYHPSNTCPGEDDVPRTLSGETRDFWNDDHDTEPLALAPCAHNALDERSGNQVLDRPILDCVRDAAFSNSVSADHKGSVGMSRTRTGSLKIIGVRYYVPEARWQRTDVDEMLRIRDQLNVCPFQ